MISRPTIYDLKPLHVISVLARPVDDLPRLTEHAIRVFSADLSFFERAKLSSRPDLRTCEKSEAAAAASWAKTPESENGRCG